MLKDWIWLTTRKGLGARGVLQVLDYFGSPERAFYADPEQYDQIPGLSALARSSLREKGMEGPDRILGECDRLGLRVLTLQDGDYPERLREIPDPPAVLYIRGTLFHFDQEAAIGIVGAREPSPYGEKVAAQLGLELARNGVLLVSGIAQGIDSIALKGALQGGGRVVSVLAGGVDVPYPWQNRYLYEDVAAAGALISEYPPGTRHNGEHFPVRNRIISGLALGVVAVECARHSGTMLTVNHAMEQNRDVFAIPGNIDAPMSEGPNWLLRQGARPVTCAQDILEEYVDRFPEKLSKAVPLSPEAAQQRLEQISPREERQEPSAKAEVVREVVPKERQKARFTDDQLSILHTLGEKQKTYTADELVELTQIPARRVLSALTMLQVDGAVENSVLFHSVTVEEGADVQYSILMPGAVVKKGAVVAYAIVAENAVIGEEATIGAPPSEDPDWGIAVVGGGVAIGDKAVVKPSAMIREDVKGGEQA